MALRFEVMNKIDLEGRHAIVTGGARGIGLAIAQRLLASGARCSLWDCDADALRVAAAALAGSQAIHTAVVDLTQPVSVKAAADTTFNAFGRIDILVNNAGISGANKKTWEFTPDEWQKVLQVNLFGVFLCCHAIVPKMIEQGYGRIVNIASVAGKEGNPNASHYSASKAGVIGFTKSLAKETARNGIIVNCITPAVIETDILKQMSQAHIDYMLSKIPMARFGLKEEAAAMVAWLCSSECSFSTGAVFDLSGGRATY
jgi:3-oxoacyl-[acyl-carrier protein] reductase